MKRIRVNTDDLEAIAYDAGSVIEGIPGSSERVAVVGPIEFYASPELDVVSVPLVPPTILQRADVGSLSEWGTA